MVVLESQTLIYSLLIYPLQKQKIFPNANFPKLASRSPISLFKFENNYLIVGRKTESSGTSIVTFFAVILAKFEHREG